MRWKLLKLCCKATTCGQGMVMFWPQYSTVSIFSCLGRTWLISLLLDRMPIGYILINRLSFNTNTSFSTFCRSYHDGQMRQWRKAHASYHIYPYKRPLPINPPPLYLCKLHISRFYIPLNSHHLCHSGIPKKDAFSTSPIEYCLQERRKSEQNMAGSITDILKSSKNMR